MKFDNTTDHINHYLFLALAFFFPISVALGNLIIFLIVSIWIFTLNYQKIKKVFANPLAVLSIVFFGMHVFALIWTENYEWGFHILKKMLDFLFILPIFLTLVKRDYTNLYINAFLISMFVTIIGSFMIWLEMIDPILKATVENPSITMSTISYNIFVSFAIYISLHRLIIQDTKIFFKWIYAVFLILLIINLFITGGRAGQVLFFFMLGAIVFQFFKYRIFKTAIFITILFPIIFILALKTSPFFEKRVSDTIKNSNFNHIENSSIGQRYTYLKNSIEVIRSNIFFGVGTGDFPEEYNSVHKINNPDITSTVNPHNMYILVTAQLGIFGLISFLSIFAYQVKTSFQYSGFNKDFGLILPLSFLLIMLSDSYLLGHYTTTLFVFFSALIFNSEA